MTTTQWKTPKEELILEIVSLEKPQKMMVDIPSTMGKKYMRNACFIVVFGDGRQEIINKENVKIRIKKVNDEGYLELGAGYKPCWFGAFKRQKASLPIVLMSM